MSVRYVPIQEEPYEPQGGYGSIEPSPIVVTAGPLHRSSARAAQRRAARITGLLACGAMFMTVVLIASTRGTQSPRRSSVRGDGSADASAPSKVVDVTSSSDAPNASAPNATALHCHPATLDHCKTLLCDHTKTPFACVAGFAKGGCAAKEVAWAYFGCDECVDLSGCDKFEQACGACTADECQRLSVTCGLKQPYACVEGGATGGCSDVADQWPKGIMTGVCTKCCDLTTCPPPPSCTKCTKAECADLSAGCLFKRPFTCSVGPAKGGCAEDEAFWKDAEFRGQCQSCCDLSDCPDLPGKPAPAPAPATSPDESTDAPAPTSPEAATEMSEEQDPSP